MQLRRRNRQRMYQTKQRRTMLPRQLRKTTPSTKPLHLPTKSTLPRNKPKWSPPRHYFNNEVYHDEQTKRPNGLTTRHRLQRPPPSSRYHRPNRQPSQRNLQLWTLHRKRQQTMSHLCKRLITKGYLQPSPHTRNMQSPLHPTKQQQL